MKLSFTTILLSLLFSNLMAISIKSPENPNKIETIAIQELKKYLSLTVEVLNVHGKIIDTIAVSSNGKEDESWQITQNGNTILITGGNSRGLLYGVYNFLETAANIRFWSPTEEFIPKKQQITLDSIDGKGKYFFEMRDMYLSGYPKDGGKTAIRRGFSRDGDRGIQPEFGGAFDYGPPYFCHTFERYIPADTYLQSNPELFSLVNGKRIGGQVTGQLCLTNPKLRELLLQKILKNIEETNLKAKENGIKAPLTYDVSHNDNTAACQCKDCAEFVAKEGQSGLMVDFVNYLAGEVAKKYPEIKLQTFAYQYTLNPPKTVKPADNVIIRLCNTYSDQITGVSQNEIFQKQLKDWAKIAKHLYIWDYAITFGDATGLPFPSEFYYPDVYKTYADNNVKGIFWEQEDPDRSDMAELKYFLHSKYMTDPYRRDFDSLMQDFMDKYYGAAGKKILEYRQLLKEAAKKGKARVSWFPTAGDFRYIDLETMKQAQKCLDEARILVKNDPEKLYRVNRAAMGLDRLLGFELTREYTAQHQMKSDSTPFPFDINLIRDRFISTWMESCKRNGEPANKDKLIKRFDEIKKMPAGYRVSDKFKKIPHLDNPASAIGCLIPDATLQIDPEAETGAAIVINADTNPNLYKYPITMGIYNVSKSAGVVSREINRTEIGGKGYFWYKIPNFILPKDDCYMYLSQSWGAQLPINSVGQLDKSKPLDIFVRMKVEGSMYLEGPVAANRIYIDRVVITQANMVK